MPSLRSIWVWIAVLCVVFGAQATAFAKPMVRDVAGHIVLCTGHGSETVLIGDDGAPLEGQPICPDCIVSLSTMGATGFEIAQRILTLAPIDYPALTAFVGAMPAIEPVSRGPPLFL